MNNRIEYVRDFWNRNADSQWYMSLRTQERIEKIIEGPDSAFHPGVYDVLRRAMPDFSGKRILLPSSGDNHAAFALALMGAQVTSADISGRQMDHAAEIAGKLGLDIAFIEDDTMSLSKIPDGEFDMVYTSNGTLSWIFDIESMYANFARVLKTGGISIMYDIHPFGRPFTCEPWKAPEIVKAYDDVLPYCHWRVCDIINAHAAAGMSVFEMAELPAVDASFWYKFDELEKKKPEELEGINDWRKNPMAALPAWICVAARKS